MLDLKYMPKEWYPGVHALVRKHLPVPDGQEIPRCPCELRELPWEQLITKAMTVGLAEAKVNVALMADGTSWIKPFLDAMGGGEWRGHNPILLNRAIRASIVDAKPQLARRLLDGNLEKKVIGNESRLGAWLLDTMYTALRSLIMPKSIKQNAVYSVVLNV
ncbi:MAG: hypothetical protein GY894_01375, partial [Planctomycetes bacterium]|nr:hypothetical protein [Planctomycetota bacterium]